MMMYVYFPLSLRNVKDLLDALTASLPLGHHLLFDSAARLT